MKNTRTTKWITLFLPIAILAMTQIAMSQSKPLVEITIGGEPIGSGITFPYPDGGPDELYEIPTYKMTVKRIGEDAETTFEVYRFGVKGEKKTRKVVGLSEAKPYIIKAWLPEYKVHSQASNEIGAWQVYDNFLIHDGPDNKDDESRPFASIGCIELCGPGKFDEFNALLIRLCELESMERSRALNKIGGSGCLRIVYEKGERPPLKRKQ